MDVNGKANVFYYKPRYTSFIESKNSFLNNIKGRIAILISKSKWVSRKFNFWESYFYTEKEWVVKYNILKSRLTQEQLQNRYKKINLDKIVFFEAVDIDHFQKFRKQIVSKFVQAGDLRHFASNIEDVLTGIENKFSTIHRGPLFHLNFSKGRRKNKNDLIEDVRCNFIKTHESYFILAFEISLSEKGKEIISTILHQEDFGLGTINYNGFRDIFLKRKFVASESMGWSLKQHNIRNFISDLSSQVKLNITKYLKGYFNDSKLSKILPRVELYEVDDMIDFKNDKKWDDLFYSQRYSLKDEQITICLSDSYQDSADLIQIIKQKGHGHRTSTKNDLTNYDNVESDHLLENLFFPCVFSAILKEQAFRLTNLKRKIYDQTVSVKTTSYLYLKKRLIQISLTNQRFESEFSNDAIVRYMDGHYNGIQISNFWGKNLYNGKEQHLLDLLKSNFGFQINELNLGVKKINQIFRSLEEIKTYKTNMYLQIASIWVGILALLSTFDGLKKWIIEESVFIIMVIKKAVLTTDFLSCF